MAFGGARPKADRSQVRHRIAVLDFTDIPDVPFDGPKLPVRWRQDGGTESRVKWPRATTRWWETIRTLPHSKSWAPSDWEFAFATAELHARISEGSAGGFVELRQRERHMGTTADARVAMRLRYVKPSVASEREEQGEAPSVPVAKLDDYRGMYG